MNLERAPSEQDRPADGVVGVPRDDQRDAGRTLAEGVASGKVILLGEHAVVYGLPAVAVPVDAVAAHAVVRAGSDPFEIVAFFPPGSGREPLRVDVATAADDDALATAVRLALAAAGIVDGPLPPWQVTLTSTVPIGSGMGSSAAVAVALVRAISVATGSHFDDRTVSDLAFEAERCVHGTPSGIDNTVIALRMPVRFAAGTATPLALAAPIHLVVADSGESGPTAALVAGVRTRYTARPATYGRWFAQIGRLVDDAVRGLASGDLGLVGRLMNANHLILQAMHVSTASLDNLVGAARAAGALGAKLSGAGGGGVIVALVDPADADDVVGALAAAGAVRVLRTTVEAGE